jgi:hypothetical protein
MTVKQKSLQYDFLTPISSISSNSKSISSDPSNSKSISSKSISSKSISSKSISSKSISSDPNSKSISSECSNSKSISSESISCNSKSISSKSSNSSNSYFDFGACKFGCVDDDDVVEERFPEVFPFFLDVNGCVSEDMIQVNDLGKKVVHIVGCNNMRITFPETRVNWESYKLETQKYQQLYPTVKFNLFTDTVPYILGHSIVVNPNYIDIYDDYDNHPSPAEGIPSYVLSDAQSLIDQLERITSEDKTT